VPFQLPTWIFSFLTPLSYLPPSIGLIDLKLIADNIWEHLHNDEREEEDVEGSCKPQSDITKVVARVQDQIVWFISYMEWPFVYYDIFHRGWHSASASYVESSCLLVEILILLYPESK